MSHSSKSGCSDSKCGCHASTKESPQRNGLARRDFLRLAGAGAAMALTFRPWETAMAGPFTRADFDKLVPEDKKLSPEWVKSLFERGTPTVYTKSRRELDHIGMPIGGICAGQLYLGGDGRLWHWDVFNRRIGTGAEHYASPLKPESPVDQGFALRYTVNGTTQNRGLDAPHWKDVSFNGEYPIAHIAYADPDSPVSVQLEAFSPFIPLNADDSSLPATVMEFTLKNVSQSAVEGEMAGWLQNAVCLYSGQKRSGLRRNRFVRETGWNFLECTAEPSPQEAGDARPDIVFDDFESGTYDKWTASGTAFGTAPAEVEKIPAYQGDVGACGKRLVNSHATAPGKDVGEKDAATGRLTSKTFTIERNHLNFLIGGGSHEGKTCVNLLVEGKVVQSATGANDNHMQPKSWDVRPWIGKTGQLEIVDEESGGWGNIGVDEIVFSDRPGTPSGPLNEEEDFGSMGLALLDARPEDFANTSLSMDGILDGLFTSSAPVHNELKTPFDRKLVGSVARKFKLAAGESVKITFVLTWHFANLKMNGLPPGRFYGSRFKSAREVAAFVVKDFNRLASQTRLWHQTWYDSTLPYWFLDRTFLNTSILASATCHRFGDGRFYSWEGVGCCEGTCGHVWHYAHAVARIFPELERILREKVDLGLALQGDGAVHFRGEFNNIPAIDAQAGTVLRALREHQMSADDAFLKRNWSALKRVMDWLIAKDGNGDGLIESNQHNTLDTDWFGPVTWLSGLYLSALLAAEAMALEMEDHDYAVKCRGIFDIGRQNLVKQLFNSEFFTNKVDPKHLDAINSGTGCEIDQVMGQSWAFQVGLPRVFPEKETLAALHSLWRYNFTPDVGPYRAAYKPGRWYAMAGEAGLLMCSFPRADWDYNEAKGKGPDWAAGYFNECMNGFEYQAAGHMLWEGMVMEGLAVTRAVHDRYHAARRNPWNEVECGDHYVRSMASYGVFLGACGFEYHGPHGYIAFAPRLTPENFRSPFTTAEGWGTYEQLRQANAQVHKLSLTYGQLQLTTLSFVLEVGKHAQSVALRHGDRTVKAQILQSGDRVTLKLEQLLLLKSGETLDVRFNV